jgi:hypothetical protein
VARAWLSALLRATFNGSLSRWFRFGLYTMFQAAPSYPPQIAASASTQLSALPRQTSFNSVAAFSESPLDDQSRQPRLQGRGGAVRPG